MVIKKNLALLCPLLLMSLSSSMVDARKKAKTVHSSAVIKDQIVHPEVHYKVLAIQAELLIQAKRYDEAIPMVVTLLKETGGQNISRYTTCPLNDAILAAIAVDGMGQVPDMQWKQSKKEATRFMGGTAQAPIIDWNKARKEFEKLITKDTNAYAQAQGYVWLGTLRYLERGCGKNLAQAKNYFKEAISLNSNRNASAQAKLALGILYSFQKKSFLKKAFSSKKAFEKSRARLVLRGASFLQQAANQTDSAWVATYAKMILEAVSQNMKNAKLDFQIESGTVKKTN